MSIIILWNLIVNDITISGFDYTSNNTNENIMIGIKDIWEKSKS